MTDDRKEQEYNLPVSTYVEKEDTREDVLRREIDRIADEIEG